MKWKKRRGRLNISIAHQNSILLPRHGSMELGSDIQEGMLSALDREAAGWVVEPELLLSSGKQPPEQGLVKVGHGDQKPLPPLDLLLVDILHVNGHVPSGDVMVWRRWASPGERLQPQGLLRSCTDGSQVDTHTYAREGKKWTVTTAFSSGPCRAKCCV